MMQEYESLIDKLVRAKDAVLTSILIEQSEEDRIGSLRLVFEKAVEYQNDEAAEKYFELLLSAIRDAELTPFLKDEKGKKVLPYSELAEEKIEKIKKDSADIAVYLYKNLPKDENSRSVVLAKTKTALILEIAKSWREIKDENEADQIFESLLEIYKKGSEIFEDVIRKATDRGFSYLRLVRHFLLCASKVVPAYNLTYSSIAQILAIALGRNGELSVTASIFHACRPILQSYDERGRKVSSSAFDLLRRTAVQISLLDSAVCEIGYSMSLGEYPWTPLSLRKKYSQLSKEGYEKIYGEINILYPDINSVEVAVIQKGERSWEKNENKYHDEFEKIKKHVLRWKKEHPQFKVYLKLVVKSEWKEQFFSREQNF